MGESERSPVKFPLQHPATKLAWPIQQKRERHHVKQWGDGSVGRNPSDHDRHDVREEESSELEKAAGGEMLLVVQVLVAPYLEGVGNKIIERENHDERGNAIHQTQLTVRGRRN